jgi:hypothetical protein
VITIAFYSYKGGVGRSLTLMNLAVYVAQFGATVVVVDFDLEAPGLQYKVRPGRRPVEVNRGLAGLLAAASVGRAPAELDYDIAIDVTDQIDVAVAQDGLEQERGRLLLVPAGNPLDPNYWTDLSEIDWQGLFTSADRPGVDVLARLRRSIMERYEPELLLVDSRTGITPSAGVSTTLLPDIVVALLLNNPEHLDGSRTVISTIASSNSQSGEPPRVLPVLGRYTHQSLTDQFVAMELRGRGPVASRLAADFSLRDEEVPVAAVHEALTSGLDPATASRVATPMVLHADLRLQQQEYLSFGPYALDDLTEPEGALLEDYIRLFSALVPTSMVSRHLAGVRNRVKAILLDRPADAVRTLENLAALVGDEGVFVDLIKIHTLRNDSASMLHAAQRLYRIHGILIVEPPITSALRALTGTDRPSRVRPDPVEVDPEFLEAYWRRAASDDVEWGAGIARLVAANGDVDGAEALCIEIVSATGGVSELALVVQVMAGGDSDAETIAVQLATQYFDVGVSSPEFVRAAALACGYHPSQVLAQRITESPAFGSLPEGTAIDILLTAGQQEEASELLLRYLGSAEPDDPSVHRLSSNVVAFATRNRELRAALKETNPTVLTWLDTARDDRPRPPRSSRYIRTTR